MRRKSVIMALGIAVAVVGAIVGIPAAPYRTSTSLGETSILLPRSAFCWYKLSQARVPMASLMQVSVSIGNVDRHSGAPSPRHPSFSSASAGIEMTSYRI